MQDPEARAAIAQLVKERETQEAALAAREAKLAERERALATVQARTAAIAQGSTAFARDPELLKFLGETAGRAAPPDPDSDEYVAWVAEQRALAVVQAFMEKITQADQRAAQERAKAEAEAQRQAQVRKDAAYIQEHLDDFKDPAVHERVRVLVTRGFTLKEAHETTLAERLATETKDLRELKERSSAAARARASRGGRPATPPVLEPPKGLSAVERDRWYEEHPEAKAHRLANHRRSGVGYGS